MRLIIIGRVNIETVSDLFKLQEPGTNQIWLFADYSTDTVPVSTEFAILKHREVVYRYKTILRDVRDQFGNILGEIPEGWKTICLIEFPGGIPGDLTKQRIYMEWPFNMEPVYLINN